MSSAEPTAVRTTSPRRSRGDSRIEQFAGDEAVQHGVQRRRTQARHLTDGRDGGLRVAAQRLEHDRLRRAQAVVSELHRHPAIEHVIGTVQCSEGGHARTPRRSDPTIPGAVARRTPRRGPPFRNRTDGHVSPPYLPVRNRNPISEHGGGMGVMSETVRFRTWAIDDEPLRSSPMTGDYQIRA